MRIDFDRVIDRKKTGSSKWDRFSPDVIPMTVADMDFACPPGVLEAIRRRAEHPVFGYPLPGDSVREALCCWFREKYGYSLDPDWIVVLPGVVPALTLAVTLEEGDSIISTPNYHVLLGAAARAGRNTVLVPCRNENEHYSLDFDRLEKAVTPQTGHFLLVNPQNPVGRDYTLEELRTVTSFAARHGLLVISDEIHGELVYDRDHIPFLTVDDYALTHSVTFLAPGKTCNISGSSLAFAVIPHPGLREQFQKRVRVFPHAGSFEIEMTIAAYRDCEDWKKQLINYLRGNRDYLEAELKRRFPEAVFPHTEGTYLQWVDFSGVIPGNAAEDLLEHARVALSNGTMFGGNSGSIRLNFACPRATLTEVLDRIERSVRRNPAL